ncbi:hypothetical protein [uncultured Ottowia sp.]|uniref:hypothetical protein n=1 Tax=uncultured Ottowia sp. TaxID=543067 RepID=UPI00259458DA|nr:hypothetical protein [uncultured Ottowia sp.]
MIYRTVTALRHIGRIGRFAGAAALAALASTAHSQAVLSLTCPTAAAGPATPLTFATGAGWERQHGGSWGAATTTYKHSLWYSPPAGTAWLSPADRATNPTFDTTNPIPFRSPGIQVNNRIDLSSIQTSIQVSVDNDLLRTGVSNTANPGGVFVATAQSGFGALSAAFIPALTWTHGANRLIFEVKNAEATLGGPLGGPMGIYATVTVTANCNAAPASAVQAVPANAPWALLLAGLGVAGLAARQRGKPSR